MDYLLFIDTNILLDFYRLRRSDISLSYLEKIEEHKDILITGSQIEMEFKKNRQAVILQSLKNIKAPDWNVLGEPTILSTAEPVKIINRTKKEIERQQSKLAKRIIQVLKKPEIFDPVYKTLQRVFKNDNNFSLTREKRIRFTIRNLAKKRFLLGYPPRKKDDISIGDAINWEWIVHCAKEYKKI